MSNQKAQEAYLRETKALMRSTLEAHGVTITDGTPFRAYVEGINEAVANSAGNDEELAEVRAKMALVLDTPKQVDSKPTAPLHIKAEDLAGVSTIRRYALYQHYGLTSLEVPENVSSIENSACNGCSNLETLVLPKKIRLQSGCFTNCTGLRRVYLPTIADESERPVLNSNTVFPAFDLAPACDFIVSDATMIELYQADARWAEVILGRIEVEPHVIEGAIES